jgi:hypothetical protein
MNEWGFIGQETLVALGKSATIYKFKQRCGFEQRERLVLSNPHSSHPFIGAYLKNDDKRFKSDNTHGFKP